MGARDNFWNAANQSADELAKRQQLAQSGQEEQGNERLKALLQGQAADAKQTRDMAGVKQLQELAPDGAGVHYENAAITPDPYARMAKAGMGQGKQFSDAVGKAYSGINDQLDAGRATLDSLNQKNAASDKLALINEARLAAGAGGSRAIKSIMDSLTGGKTGAMDFQGAMNYLNNTSDIPTMQDAQRDAIRESVYGRLGQLKSQHQQIGARMGALGPTTAPMADTASILNAYTKPIDQKFGDLDKSYQDYQTQRKQMGGRQIGSGAATADPAPSTVDKLKSFFSGGGKPAAPAPAGGFDPDAYLGKKQ